MCASSSRSALAAMTARRARCYRMSNAQQTLTIHVFSFLQKTIMLKLDLVNY